MSYFKYLGEPGQLQAESRHFPNCKMVDSCFLSGLKSIAISLRFCQLEYESTACGVEMKDFRVPGSLNLDSNAGL